VTCSLVTGGAAAATCGSSTAPDEHSLKNVAAAAKLGVPTRVLVDRHAEEFRALGPLLDIASDDFIRTSVDARHEPATSWLWRACEARGDLYKRRWHGRYCVGCEAFVEDDVVICEEHGVAPEPVSEDNWFFRLSRYREPVRDAIASGRVAIVPESARAETLAFLDGEVRDLSVSRDAARGDWGIRVPGDPTQLVYVWFDALAGYLASLGLGGDETLLDRYWRSGGERAHVIGKGISRFHAVYWPAFLLSAGLPLPDRVLVHGYLTIDGKKIAKSGRGAEVSPVVDELGADALRWYFVRRCRTRGDSDVKRAELAAAYDGDIADRLGNLVQRCIALAARVSDGRVPARADDPVLRAAAEALPARVDAALDGFLFDDAVGAIIGLVDAANRALEASAPWRVARTDAAAAAASLYAPLEAARVAAGELAPFVPGVARVIAERLGDAPLDAGWGKLAPGARLRAGPPPFPRRAG
jgi:methionyl-tRNA synthetase